VIDEQGAPLSYATVALLNPSDSTLMFFGITNTTGVYQIKNVKKGNYVMQFSYVGAKTSTKNITVSDDSPLNYGDKVMQSQMLGEVKVIAEYIPITFNKDTIEYNAKAFAVKPDAVAEDLLKKIPGVEVDESGNVKAQGEDVTKVLVDGKEFFGKDLKVATKNLPANAIDKVQVYDKKSEDAEFMGTDDGVRDRTINLVLNEKYKKGYFGNVEAGGSPKTGGSSQEYFKTEGKIYRFSSKSQIAALGMYNNINEFGYSSKGHEEWGKTIDGLNKTVAGGFNMSYNPTSKKRYFLSYLGSSIKKDILRESFKKNFLANGSYIQDSERDENEDEIPHIANFGVRHQFGTNSKLTLDGDFDLSSTNNMSNSLTNTSFEDTTVNILENNTLTNSKLSNASAKAVYIQKLKEKKTQLKLNTAFMYDKGLSELDWENLTTFMNPTSFEFVEQFQDNNTEKLNYSFSPTIVQEIAPLWTLTAEVNLGSDNESLQRTFGSMEVINDTLSADFKTKRNFMQPAITFQKGTEKAQLKITLGLELDAFDKINTGYDNSIGSTIEENYSFFTPGLSYENNYKTGRRIKMKYNSGVNMPSVSQLLPIINTIDPTSIYKGNIDLKPEYSHNISMMWSIFDQFSFTSLFTRIGASYTQDKISFSQTVSESFFQQITPVNVDYSQSLFGFFYFSTPFRPLGIKINLRGSENYTQGLSFINEVENINTSLAHSLKMSIENRTKKKWDVSIGGAFSITDSKFSISDSMNSIYNNTSYFADIRFTPNKKWSISAKGNVVNYSSKSFNEDLSIPLIESGISYFFLKSEKASLTIKGYDLLNKSSNISQVTTASYIMQSNTNTIGRYVMLVFRLKIGNGGEEEGGPRHGPGSGF